MDYAEIDFMEDVEMQRQAAAEHRAKTVVARSERDGTTYEVRGSGEMWTTGPEVFLCGHVADPANIERAIDAHLEELAALVADFERWG